MATDTRHWTIDDLYAIPDDGNRYEVVRGELFVTSAPTPTHETAIARLLRILSSYVEREAIGLVYAGSPVLRFEDAQVEPDLMVRREHLGNNDAWSTAPVPALVVEVLSPRTKRRDAESKRALYEDAAVGEYWMLDTERHEITVVRRGIPDLVITDELTWHPAGASAPLVFPVTLLFHGM
jgi:Uma2 family endonuclease